MHALLVVYITLCLIGLLCNGMRIGERKSYPFKHKYGTFDTKYQYFPAAKKGLFPSNNQPAIVCVHGFGGNADQFRKNLPAFSQAGYDSYALDLLGYGYGDKPNPRQYGVNALYNFDTWAEQTTTFIRDVVKKPTILVCNSVGGVAGLQAALAYDSKKMIQGIVLIDVSLRLLHVKKQNPLQKVVVPIIQQLLRETSIGSYFFKQVSLNPKLLFHLQSATKAFHNILFCY